MDPSVFFGRTRATRQTLKSKQQTTIKESENCKVNEDASKEIRKLPVKGQKAKPMTAGKENDAVKEATTTRASKRTQQALNKNAKKDELIGVKDKHKPASKSLKVHFDGDSQESPSSGGRRQSAAPCGPVYQNVRRSDVTGDPYNEYDFPLGSDSSPERTKKKKKKPIAGRTKPVKKAGGVVKWDPSKRPIIVKPKTVKKTALLEKDLTAFNATQAAKPKLNIKENPVKATLPVEANPVKATPPMKAAPPARATLPVKTTTPVEANPGKTIPPVRANPQLHSTLTPDVNGARHFTSTPVLRQPSSKKVPNTAAPSSTGSTQSLTAIPSAKGQALSVPSFGLSCTGDESFEPSSPLVMADIPCAATPTSDVPNHISLNAQASLKSQSARFASRSSYFLSLPVRESPSFGNVLESPRRSSDGLLGTERAGNLDAVTSTPVTRSRRTNCEAVKSSNTENPDKPSVSQSKVTEKVLLPSGNDSDGNLSGIFDDIPRTSVLPTRMFSTHRGTIYIPEGQNVPKRNMPEFSPSKEQTSSRATVVKFSDPASSGLEQCFGFDNEDVTFVPQPTNIVKKPPIKKPNISIPDALAILRGQSKLASPANKTPRSIQTKLTDFVCSTPTSSPARVVAVSNEPVLTPTPVPLFDEDQIDAELQSPFSQPSRRSYDRFRPVKRIACGDEVHSGDEEEQIDSESTIPVKKKSKSYKRTKKPKETQLDAWASQLASHFDEVEQVELQLE